MISEATQTTSKVSHAHYINYHLKSEVAFTLYCQSIAASTNQELFEKKYNIPRKTSYELSKNKWNTKDGTGTKILAE